MICTITIHDGVKLWLKITHPHQVKKVRVPQSFRLMLRAFIKIRIRILDDGVSRLGGMLLFPHQKRDHWSDGLIDDGTMSYHQTLVHTMTRGGLGVPWGPIGPEVTGWLTIFFNGRSPSPWFFLFWLTLVVGVNELPALIWRVVVFFTSKALLVPRSTS